VSNPGPHTFNPHNPLRDPARRWRRATYLVEHDRRPSRVHDDAITRQAWRLLRGLARNPDETARQRLEKRLAAVAEARRFALSAEPLRRDELEARLLAGQDDDVIAVKLGLSPAGVAAYGLLFFDVRPRRHASLYVATVVLGGHRVLNSLKASEHGLLLKVLGYRLGGLVVDDVLDYFQHPPTVPPCLDGWELPALKKLQAQLTLKLLILSCTAQPMDLAAADRWLQLSQRSATGAQRSSPAGEDEASVKNAIRILVDDLACLSAAVA
jgi:hypothetical protein